MAGFLSQLSGMEVSGRVPAVLMQWWVASPSLPYSHRWAGYLLPVDSGGFQEPRAEHRPPPPPTLLETVVLQEMLAEPRAHGSPGQAWPV